MILYELLSGALPHDPERLAQAAFAEVLQVLREEEPLRPSTKVSTLGERTAEVAAHRGVDGKKLAGKLRGDLDWITLKALEKDRKRRYDSPKELAEDIGRHLRLEAIEARPPSVRYRMGRFARRHRTAVATAAVALIALLSFAVWQTVQSRIIGEERDRALAYELLAYAQQELATDPTAAVAYAVASLEITEIAKTREVVREVRTRTAVTVARCFTDVGADLCVRPSPICVRPSPICVRPSPRGESC